ncbi:MAG: hypothetical protein E4H00_04215 [Myxococcales bacterium]|nr:MAG: hypothetical protein E4H00_04215 [Myxococcales bacterium]
MRDRRKPSIRQWTEKNRELRAREIVKDPVLYNDALYTEIHIICRPSGYILTLRNSPAWCAGPQHRGPTLGIRHEFDTYNRITYREGMEREVATLIASFKEGRLYDLRDQGYGGCLF